MLMVSLQTLLFWTFLQSVRVYTLDTWKIVCLITLTVGKHPVKSMLEIANWRKRNTNCAIIILSLIDHSPWSVCAWASNNIISIVHSIKYCIIDYNMHPSHNISASLSSSQSCNDKKWSFSELSGTDDYFSAWLYWLPKAVGRRRKNRCM